MRFGFGNKLPAALRRRALPAAVCLLLAIALTGRAEAQSPDRAPADPPAKNPQGNALKLDDVLAEMDKASQDFSSMTGDLEYTKVTIIVNDHSMQTGRISFEKTGGKTRVLIAFTKPAEKYVLFADGKVSLYQPKIAEVDEYQLSQRQDLLEQFLLLGFGTSGSELQKAYQITLHGAESIGGQQAYLLELVPKSVKVAAQLARIQLWISPQNWEPVQQKFFEPGGDYLISRYSNVKLNAKIPDKEFRLPIRGKVRTVRPQGQ